MNDRDLREDVERALDWEPPINAGGIGLPVTDGVVTLSGQVANFPEKREGERVAGLVLVNPEFGGDTRLPRLPLKGGAA